MEIDEVIDGIYEIMKGKASAGSKNEIVEINTCN